MTRIIAGLHRGRQLIVPEGRDVRPTTDRMRERIFSMLQHGRYPTLSGARVADIFAGTGALGLEALSRGAAYVCFVEKATQSLRSLEHNVRSLKAADQTQIIRTSANALPEAERPFSHIFMDPPYGQGLLVPAIERCLSANWAAAGSVFICEMGSNEPFEAPTGTELVDDRAQGAQRTVFLLVA